MDFSEFLLNAKISGYASGGEGGASKLEDGGFKFDFKEEGYEYSDIYYGFNPFIGQEIVRKNSGTFWVMNYWGKADCDNERIMDVYLFLRKALAKPDPELPLRGPAKFKKDDFIYMNTIHGDMEMFSGEESIRRGDDPVYRCSYHGGKIKGM